MSTRRLYGHIGTPDDPSRLHKETVSAIVCLPVNIPESTWRRGFGGELAMHYISSRETRETSQGPASDLQIEKFLISIRIIKMILTSRFGTKTPWTQWKQQQATKEQDEIPKTLDF